MDVAIVTFACFTFLLAGMVKGTIGMGLPTVAMGLLALAMTPGEAAALLVVPSLVTNALQASGPRLLPLLRRIWPLLAALCVGTWGLALWAGSGLLSADGGAPATVGLGAVLALYGLLGLAAVEPSVPSALEPWLSPLIGVVTGLVTAVTGIYMVPSVPYLQALGLARDDLVQALGLLFTVATIALAPILVRGGALHLSVAGASLLALAPAVAGMALGQWLRGRIRPRAFRLCFFGGVLLLGAHLVLRTLI
jgi:uncharacterized membrane protein YfcA